MPSREQTSLQTSVPWGHDLTAAHPCLAPGGYVMSSYETEGSRCMKRGAIVKGEEEYWSHLRCPDVYNKKVSLF